MNSAGTTTSSNIRPSMDLSPDELLALKAELDLTAKAHDAEIDTDAPLITYKSNLDSIDRTLTAMRRWAQLVDEARTPLNLAEVEARGIHRTRACSSALSVGT